MSKDLNIARENIEKLPFIEVVAIRDECHRKLRMSNQLIKPNEVFETVASLCQKRLESQIEGLFSKEKE